MIKVLIGGSPCTYWSVSKKEGREVHAEGEGWELFKNFLIAKEKFQPDFFLYENNKSTAPEIKEQIKKCLGVWDGTFLMRDSGARYQEINYSLVSAQNRERLYVHNCGDLPLPKDRNVQIDDVLNCGVTNGKHQATGVAVLVGGIKGGKARCVTAGYSFKGVLEILKSCASKDEHKQRFDGVAENQYEVVEENEGKPTKAISKITGKIHDVYPVKDKKILIGEDWYDTELDDGFWLIRKLSVEECCRLQTIPDDYCRVLSPRQAYKCIGNGWTAEIIIHILNGALKNVPKEEEIVVLSMYDGIGTGRYCLDKMGFTNVKYYAYEIDEYAKSVALSNYPDIIQKGNAFDVRNQDIKL